MVTLHHAIKIAGSRADVFRALTDIAEVAAWHIGAVEGEISSGAIFYLKPKPGLRFGWRTESIVPNSAIIQICVEGPGNSAGKTLTWTLSDADGGRAMVSLAHGNWAENDPHLPFCNTYWGEALHRLQSHVERHSADASSRETKDEQSQEGLRRHQAGGETSAGLGRPTSQ